MRGRILSGRLMDERQRIYAQDRCRCCLKSCQTIFALETDSGCLQGLLVYFLEKC